MFLNIISIRSRRLVSNAFNSSYADNSGRGAKHELPSIAHTAIVGSNHSNRNNNNLNKNNETKLTKQIEKLNINLR
jgi:hypothetical protein